MCGDNNADRRKFELFRLGHFFPLPMLFSSEQRFSHLRSDHAYELFTNTHSQLLSSSDTHVYYYINNDMWAHVHVCLHVYAMILESAATIEQWIEDETMVFSSDSNSVLSGKVKQYV